MNNNEKYGQTTTEYLTNVINSISSGYLGKQITTSTLTEVKILVENALKRLGLYGYLKPNLSLDRSGITINFEQNDLNDLIINKLVIISPNNEKTHNWAHSASNMTGKNLSCKRCKIYKLELLSLDYYENERTIFATENLSCNEVLVKDVIE